MPRLADATSSGVEPGWRACCFELADAARHIADADIAARRHGAAHEVSRRSDTIRPCAHRMPGANGTRNALDAEASRHFGRCSGPAPPNGSSAKCARIVPALDRDRADRAHHVGDHDAEHAVRGALDGKAEPARERRDRGARGFAIERHAAADQAACGDSRPSTRLASVTVASVPPLP